MVAFCAMCTLQSVNSSTSEYLSDWSLFRLATLQELVALLELQGADRHPLNSKDDMHVVDAMARQLSRGIRSILRKKKTANPAPFSTPPLDAFAGLPPFAGTPQAPAFDVAHPASSSSISQYTSQPPLLQFDDLAMFTFASSSMPTMADWELAGGALPVHAYMSQAGSDLHHFNFGWNL